MNDKAATTISLRDAAISVGGRTILGPITWSVASDERWVVLGANGSGKTTLLRLVSAARVPSAGEAVILGERLGRCDMRVLRARIGHSSARLGAALRPTLTALDVVMTARHAALEPWWHAYTDADRARARELLAAAGLDGFDDRTFGSLSEGERQRVLVSRAFMGPVELVTLDEPAVGLDLRNRELLVRMLGSLAAAESSGPIILVTHHVEEIPPGFTHALLLRDGVPAACGPLSETLTSESVSATFGAGFELERRGDRFWAYLREAGPAARAWPASWSNSGP